MTLVTTAGWKARALVKGLVHGDQERFARPSVDKMAFAQVKGLHEDLSESGGIIHSSFLRFVAREIQASERWKGLPHFHRQGKVS